MSSSFKQKKMKTLATRKKTRKRRMQLGLTVNDDSGRLFQPPSKRDPRWKKPSLDALVTGVVKRQKVSHGVSGDDDDDDDDEANDSDASSAGNGASDKDEEVDDGDSDDDKEQDGSPPEVPRVPLLLCKSLEDCAVQAEAKHREIRRGDGRQKAKVLMLVDSPSLFKAIKNKMSVRAEPVRSKSRVGIRSVKQNNMAFRNIGALKTPMERFQDANKEVLRDFKSGKLPSLLAEDTSFFPYSDLCLQHVIYVAKRVATLTAIDCSLLSDGATPHFFLLREGGAALSADDREALEDQAFEIV